MIQKFTLDAETVKEAIETWAVGRFHLDDDEVIQEVIIGSDEDQELLITIVIGPEE